ncbi:MAG: hypothetical protein ABSE76_02230 [Minisyncoccia bacterium]|jgi:hypothetical protein
MKILYTVWLWARWPLAFLVVAYIALVIYRIPAVGEKQRTADTIAAIQAQKITMADVMGTDLPPQPYKPENDATVAGIDKNNNGIRDDVELAIFAKYPNSAKIRAAELQYAMTEQMFLTDVYNTDTWKAVAEEDDRAYTCALNVISYDQTREVQDLVFNTQARKDAETKAYTFTTSNGPAPGPACDIDLNSLPN